MATQQEQVKAAATTAVDAAALTSVTTLNVALLRGCRTAVTKQLGRRSANNQAFWVKYEACMTYLRAG